VATEVEPKSMTEQIKGLADKRAHRPAGRGQTIGVRMQPDEIADIDAWIATRAHKLTRPEAIRQLALTRARIDLDSGD
jgi:hypothetical protein